MMRTLNTLLSAAPLAFLLLAFDAGGAAGQDIPSLNAVESYLAHGRIVEARAALEAWLAAEGEDASRSDRQRSLWLRAKLTVDPSMAAQDLRRLALEYPGGPYSDDALFRLGLFAEARGDLRAASRRFGDLVRNYPVSPFREEAEDWLQANAEAIAALPAESPPGAEAPPDPILGERPEPEERTDSLSARASGEFAVQVGAFLSTARARSLADRLTEAGFVSRLVMVPGSELVRVRVGRFATREEAGSTVEELENAGFEVTIATDAESEEVIG